MAVRSFRFIHAQTVPTHADKGLAVLAKVLSMTDIDTAQAVFHEVWKPGPGVPIKVRVAEIFAALQKVERELPADELRSRDRQWTLRRVVAIWKHEARRIDNYEMIDIEEAAKRAARAEFEEATKRARRMDAFITGYETSRRSQRYSEGRAPDRTLGRT